MQLWKTQSFYKNTHSKQPVYKYVDLIVELYNNTNLSLLSIKYKHRSHLVRITKTMRQKRAFCFTQNITVNTVFGTCVSGESAVASINYFPVCGLLALFLRVSTETVVCGFWVKTQNFSLLMDPEREGGHWCSNEDSRKVKNKNKNKNNEVKPEGKVMKTVQYMRMCKSWVTWTRFTSWRIALGLNTSNGVAKVFKLFNVTQECAPTGFPRIITKERFQT